MTTSFEATTQAGYAAQPWSADLARAPRGVPAASVLGAGTFRTQAEPTRRADSRLDRHLKAY